jgi:hypothetical protein
MLKPCLASRLFLQPDWYSFKPMIGTVLIRRPYVTWVPFGIFKEQLHMSSLAPYLDPLPVPRATGIPRRRERRRVGDISARRAGPRRFPLRGVRHEEVDGFAVGSNEFPPSIRTSKCRGEAGVSFFSSPRASTNRPQHNANARSRGGRISIACSAWPGWRDICGAPGR